MKMIVHLFNSLVEHYIYNEIWLITIGIFLFNE